MEKLRKRKKKAGKGPEYEIGAREKGFLKPKSGRKWQKIEEEKKLPTCLDLDLKNGPRIGVLEPKIAKKKKKKKKRKGKKARKGPEYEILKNWAEN